MLEQWQNIEFYNPGMLGLLLLIPLVFLYFYWKKPLYQPMYIYSDLTHLAGIKSWRNTLIPLPVILRTLAFIFLVLALARPQLSLTEEEIKAEGIDIMLVLDLSSSMLAQDFSPDRLTVSKQVAAAFVDKRRFDRIGLVIFAGESFTQSPLTTDHAIIKKFINDLNIGILQDGTAIGMGLATAVNRLKDSEAESKVIILMTDGVNNAGYITPMTAAEIARQFNVKVYTVGVGSEGSARSPINRRSDGRYVYGMARVEIDEELLKQISTMTDARYYRALDEESLENIYREIDRLEKTEMEIRVFKRYEDKYRIFVISGILLLLLEFLFSKLILRTLP